MRSSLRLLAIAVLAALMVGAAGPAPAQFKGLKDKVREKVKEKAEEKADEKADEILEGSEADSAEVAPEDSEGEEPAETTEQVPAKAAGGSATAEDMALYTKYDFVPGDRVIFYDDLSGEELGEFPSRWNLAEGVFEIAKQHGQNWILCTDEGTIRPKVPAGPLSQKYTVEMDFYTKGGQAKGHWFHLKWVDEDGRELGQLTVQDKANTSLIINNQRLADKALPSPLAAGRHTMRVMATKTTLKCYVDHERVANVPAVEEFAPVGFAVTMDPWKDEPDNPMLVGAFRYAEGGKTLKQQLDEAGRIVTHGILFDPGSDRIKAGSYKTLADIGGLLTENPALRLSIEGHTDADGADDYNLKLSQSRAVSVRAYLMDNYKVDGGRLETQGLGETEPIAGNDTPEGKATNRRVELVKL